MDAFQFSTMNALMLGHFSAVLRVSSVLEHGSVGLGTFEGLDGEAIIIDGEIYNGLPGGKIRSVALGEKMAFGVVAPFQIAGTVFQTKSVADMETLKKRVDEVRMAECKSNNYICFARIDGVFDRITVRSCSKQTVPYKPLFEVAKSQVETTKDNVEGTLLGFWFPKYMEGINLPGWHFHFISRDLKSFGGHCLECSLKNGMISTKRVEHLELVLPTDIAFEKLDFDQDLREKTASVEGKSQRK